MGSVGEGSGEPAYESVAADDKNPHRLVGHHGSGTGEMGICTTIQERTDTRSTNDGRGGTVRAENGQQQQ